MSQLKRNILASYISQIYLAVISIAILPIYIKYMGAEAYGLVGFFAMLQGLFNLLDFGLTPTISRQTAQYNAGVQSKLMYRQLYRTLGLIFSGIAVFGGGALYYLNDFIAKYWLNLESLDHDDVLFCLEIIAVCVALRWMTGLYRGVISGFEKIVWLSVINIVIATLRFPGVLLYMYYFGFTIRSFFIFQFAIAIFEFLALAFKTRVLLPKVKSDEKVGWSFKPIKPLLGFALTIAFTSAVWVLLTQLDKFILSGILSLSDYGYFTLAVLVAGGVLQVSVPISTVIMPRLACLFGENKFTEMKDIYLMATQIVALAAVSTGIVLAVLAKPVLYIWTGDIVLAHKAGPILTLYSIGNSLLALSAFPYYLQYAKGDLKYHFLGNLISLIVLVPIIILVAKNYGSLGVGYVWLIFQVVYLIFWVSYVHMKIEPNINFIWFKTFLPIIISVSMVSLGLSEIIDYSENRLIGLGQIMIISLLSLIAAVLSSSSARNFFKNKVLKCSV